MFHWQPRPAHPQLPATDRCTADAKEGVGWVGGWLGGEQGCQGRGGGKQTKTWTVKYINKQFGQKSSPEPTGSISLRRDSEREIRQLSNLRKCESALQSKFSGPRVSQIDGKFARKHWQIIVKMDCGSAQCGLSWMLQKATNTIACWSYLSLHNL